MLRHHAYPRLGLTIIELVVVALILAILSCLLLPAMQGAREASRRASCQNNLKQVGIALLQFEDNSQELPIGAKHTSTFGVSWWVQIAALLEESAVSDRFDQLDEHSGFAPLHAENGRLVHQLYIGTMYCPSSSLPALKRVSVFELMMPSYVGVSGASSHDGFLEKRVSVCCAPDNDGEISGGGALIPNAAIYLRQITDGLSKTMVVAETSDFAVDYRGRTFRIDGGNPNGWITGTTATGTPPTYNHSFYPPSWNITTVRYAVNMRDYDRPGIDDNRGANNPFISAHPNGVHALFVDGSVRFVCDEINVVVIKRAATRDDSNGLL